MSDDRIRAFCQDRAITRVCHFTQSRNLAQILSEPAGILSSFALETQSPGVLNRNDPKRLDGRPDHISASIEYPNSWNFRLFRNKELLFKDWVVLFIDPSVLWESDNLYCPRNAGVGPGHHQSGLPGLEALYAPYVDGTGGRRWSRTPNYLPCCPTDGQAEVLVPRCIPRSLIIGVAGPSVDSVQVEIRRLRYVSEAISLPWFAVPSFYEATWRNYVVAGQRPPETPVEAP